MTLGVGTLVVAVLLALLPTSGYAMGVDEWLRLPQPERTVFLRGLMDAWGLQEQLARTSKPPLATPPHLTTVVTCVDEVKMTDGQALQLVEGYMREHPGVLRELPMAATVWVALVRACRIIGPGEKTGAR
jgi:hypothetical protein